MIVSFGLIDKCPKNNGENTEITKKNFETSDPKKYLTTFFNPNNPAKPTKKLIK